MQGKLERITLGKIEEVAKQQKVQQVGTATFQERMFVFGTIKLTIDDRTSLVDVPLRQQSPNTMPEFLGVVDTYLAQNALYLAEITELETRWPDMKYAKGTLYQEQNKE